MNNGMKPERVQDLKFVGPGVDGVEMCCVAYEGGVTLYVCRFSESGFYITVELPPNGDLGIVTDYISFEVSQYMMMGFPRDWKTEDEVDSLLLKYAHPHLFML